VHTSLDGSLEVVTQSSQESIVGRRSLCLGGLGEWWGLKRV